MRLNHLRTLFFCSAGASAFAGSGTSGSSGGFGGSGSGSVSETFRAVKYRYSPSCEEVPSPPSSRT